MAIRLQISRAMNTRHCLAVLVVASTISTSCSAQREEDAVEQASELAANVWSTEGDALNVRERPTTSSRIVATVPPNGRVDIACQTEGDAVEGNPVWNFLPAYGGYAADAFLWTGYDGFSPSIPRCKSSGVAPAPAPAPAASPPGFMLPLACGASATITQGNGGAFSHTGAAHYGFDFDVQSNTTLHAIEDGTVSLVRNDVRPGSACYAFGGYDCRNTLNYVVIAHADGTDSAYLHINSALVAQGQRVRRGEAVALSGGTGWSTGPHAHVQRQQRCGIWWCQSVAVSFGDVAGGVPGTGQVVTSRNCD